MRHFQRVTGLLLILGLGCESPTGPDVAGQWGGAEADLTLAASGGSIEYPCATATIDPAWKLSRDGHWSGTGQHFFGGGPLPAGGQPPHPVSYSGQLTGKTLTFTVTLLDLHQVLGPYTVERGRSVALNYCL